MPLQALWYILRWPVSHHKAGAILSHHPDALAKLTCSRVDPAEDAAMGFFEPHGIEWAFDGARFDSSKRQKYGIRFEPIEVSLGAIVAVIDENIRAGIAIRIVLEWTHAILEAAGT
jgi:hypothetical protein